VPGPYALGCVQAGRSPSGARGHQEPANLYPGPRTAGAYFAPLVEAYLVRAGLPTLGWLSIRPKVGLTTKERRLVEKALKAGGRIVVVDDHPNSGDTFALILKILRPLGAEPTDVLILAPSIRPKSIGLRRYSPLRRSACDRRSSTSFACLETMSDCSRLRASSIHTWMARS